MSDDSRDDLLARLGLQGPEQRYRLLAENVSDVIFLADLDLRMAFVSPSVQRLRGVTVETATGQSIAEFLQPESAALARNTLDHELCREGQPGVDPDRSVVLEFEERRPDGSTIWTENTVSFLRDQAGRAIGVLGVSRDISDRVKSQREHERLVARLYQADKMTTVGQLAAGVAHEINNPIGFILPNLQFLAEVVPRLLETVSMARRGADPDELAGFCGRHQLDDLAPEIGRILADSIEGAKRIRDTIRELRMFARGDEGDIALIRLEELIESCLIMTSAQIKHRARVTREYANLAPVAINRGKMSQVLLNILLNAAQAIPEGDVDRHWIHIRTGRTGPEAFVEIANNGATIPADVLPRIFDPFFTTKPLGQATGLGLSIAYTIVQQHGGHIQVESDEQDGTRFRVRLPVFRPQESGSV